MPLQLLGPGGLGPDLLLAAVFLPLAAALVCFLLPRLAATLGLISALLTAAATLALMLGVLAGGGMEVQLGGWQAPLGIRWRSDGLSAALMAMTAVVGAMVSLYAAAYFRHTAYERTYFWPIWLVLWAALNALFLSADLFNLYVTLELLGFAAVSLTALGGGAAALTGAIRYLLVSVLGSLAYLLGVALVYHGCGTVDIALVAACVPDAPRPALKVAVAAMIAGLLLKTALFPFHVWLPPAHGSAPAPVSAVLSALVVKASFYLVLRLWLDVLGGGDGDGSGRWLAELLGVLGAAAVIWGSVLALRQARLKLLIAYSTVAQIGYLFMAFPLAVAGGAAAWTGALYLALAHGLAKAAMFLSAGSLLRFGGHDRIAELDSAVHRLPLTLTAFALAGVSIMGLPPSGGFIGKWLLLEAAFQQGRFVLAAVILLGGVLAAAYVFKVVGHAFTPAERERRLRSVPPGMEWSALLLALAAIVLGLTLPLISPLLQVGTDAAVAPPVSAAVALTAGGAV
ncbi:proton-conducting transporter membrane subunit [uncultured Thiohalocapsa sp.]|uniref:complex I subunit 5 family protein n=1 Tax=uncultured Thiohalocapsa sp. TaxID=768990 RepID=UPI0025D194B9|nr:proton-conducting transporter membrane subunit [uncultured Thiohalocapsa sp.]